MIDENLLWNTYRKLWSPFQNLSSETAYSAPWRIYTDDVISGLQENLIISEMVYDRRTMSTEHN